MNSDRGQALALGGDRPTERMLAVSAGYENSLFTGAQRAALSAALTGKTPLSEMAIHFTVTDGRITRDDMHEDSYAIS